MKKSKIISITLAFAIAMGTGFAVCSCSKNDINTTETDTQTASLNDTTKVTEETVPETEAETESKEEFRVPVENERAEEIAKIQFDKAMEVIGWVRLVNMPIDDSAPANQSGTYDTTDELSNNSDSDYELLYYRVIDTTERPELDGEYITTFALMKKYIKSIFARTIADHLIEEAELYYADVDGILCRIVPEEEILDPSDVLEKEFFLSKFTDSLFRYTAKVNTGKIDEEGKEVVEYYDFVFENTGSGWYWTQFPKIEGPEPEETEELPEEAPDQNGEVNG